MSPEIPGQIIPVSLENIGRLTNEILRLKSNNAKLVEALRDILLMTDNRPRSLMTYQDGLRIEMAKQALKECE